MELSKNPPKVSQFKFAEFLRTEHRFGLDPTRRVCPYYHAGYCPQGNACLDRHLITRASDGPSFHPAAVDCNNRSSMVCKHWVRSLCQVGENCRFSHEYNLRFVPECSFFIRLGHCTVGEECPFRHVSAQSKMPICKDYEQGFCPLGPECKEKHPRRTMCPSYLTGFCPDGNKFGLFQVRCEKGMHPKWQQQQQQQQEKKEKKKKRIDVQQEQSKMPRWRGGAKQRGVGSDFNEMREYSCVREGGGRVQEGGGNEFAVKLT